jgi:two-component system sensor histidine kinase KdpD
MRWRSLARDTVLVLAVVAGVSVLVGAAESVRHVSNISNLYIIGIALLALRRGVYPALAASALAFLVYDWFFVPPLHEFSIADPTEYVALMTLLVTIVIIGQLLALARKRADELQIRQRQTQLLYDVGQAVLTNPATSTVYPMALWRLNDTLRLTGSRLFLKDRAGLCQVDASGTLQEIPEQCAWLDEALRVGQPLVVWEQPRNNVRVTAELHVDAAGIEPPEGVRLYRILLPVSIESRVEGVLVVGQKKDQDPMTSEDRQLLLAFANQLAIAVDRQKRAEQEARALALEESDRLKSSLVSSVSHELKTPLAAIKASVTTLLTDAADPSASIRRELTEAINRETDRLTRLVGNLLDMSRLEAGALRPRFEWVSIVDVLAEVLDRMDPILSGREIKTELPDDLPATPLDFVQISQVLTNLLDNAMQYSPPDAEIVISAEIVHEQLRVTVFNEGSRLPTGDLEHVFDKFFRLSTATGGVGLGLSIARGIVAAHGGRIWATNVGGRGVAVTFVLPSPAPLQTAAEATGARHVTSA